MKTLIYIYAVLALIIGLALGYLYGVSRERSAPEQVLLPETVPIENQNEEISESEEELIQKTNPFTQKEAGYKNPFKSDVFNPFSQ